MERNRRGEKIQVVVEEIKQTQIEVSSLESQIKVEEKDNSVQEFTCQKDISEPRKVKEEVNIEDTNNKDFSNEQKRKDQEEINKLKEKVQKLTKENQPMNVF